jgi:flagellar basal body-associated protein FliL
MAFCNSCGATLTPGTKFCNKCGAPQAAGTLGSPAASFTPVPAAAPVPVQPATGGSSALKIILIVIAVLVVIGILGVATVGFIGWRIAKSAHVTQNGDNVKVETPFGSVESSKDPEQAAKDLGIDIYPGAELRKNGAQSASFGSLRTVTANFDSTDPADKVCAFYKQKFPAARVSSSDPGRCTIVSNDQRNMVTINVEANGDSSKFQVSSVRKRSN